MRSITALFIMFLLAAPAMLQAGPMQAFVFDNPEQEALFKRLSHEIRCLVCQNQSIADSNAGLATDLREEIYNMIKQGKSESEITGFLVERYGDFVLYDPPMKPVTWMLWFGPALMFAVGLYFALGFIRSHRATEAASPAIAESDSERLKDLQQEARHDFGKDRD